MMSDSRTRPCRFCASMAVFRKRSSVLFCLILVLVTKTHPKPTLILNSNFPCNSHEERLITSHLGPHVTQMRMLSLVEFCSTPPKPFAVNSVYKISGVCTNSSFSFIFTVFPSIARQSVNAILIFNASAIGLSDC